MFGIHTIKSFTYLDRQGEYGDREKILLGYYKENKS